MRGNSGTLKTGTFTHHNAAQQADIALSNAVSGYWRSLFPSLALPISLKTALFRWLINEGK